MGPSPYAMQLSLSLKALRELEQARGDARAALGVVDDRGPHHLSDELRAALSRVERGDHPVPAQQPAPLQTPAAAEHSVPEAYSRRQAARSRPYSEGRAEYVGGTKKPRPPSLGRTVIKIPSWLVS